MFSQENLETWRNVIKAKQTKPNNAFIAEREILEALVKQTTERLAKDLCHVYWDKWIPVNDDAPCDVAVMILTPRKLICLEFKNWKGTLESDFSGWQWADRPDNIRRMSPLTDSLSDKVKHISSYLKECGLELPRNFIEAKVILNNPELDVSPMIQKDKMVICHDKVDAYFQAIRGLNRKERTWQKVTQMVTNKDSSKILIENLYNSITVEEFKKIHRSLHRLRSWDKVGLYGGAIIRGRLKMVEIEDHDIDMEHLKPGQHINVKWNRRKYSALFWGGLLGKKLGKMTYGNFPYLLHPTKDRLFFYQVGFNDKPKEIPLVEIDWFENGEVKVRKRPHPIRRLKTWLNLDRDAS